jgi:N-acetylmuramoyl-L-alanine amidase
MDGAVIFSFRFSIAVLLALALAASSALPVQGGQPPLKGFWYQGRIVVAVKPLSNEGYIQIAERVMQHPRKYRDVIAFNGNRPVQRGRSVRFPLSTLKMPMRGNILRAMYPEDELTEKGWAHSVTDPLETFIQLTEAYTGSKRRFRELARLNRITNADVLRAGAVITIPLKWIPRELGFQPTSVKKPLGLVYDKATGRTFATYTLRKDETLYSVILRYTDRERAAEVRRMAELMLKLNGIRGATSVPAGRPMRMPVEWLSPEYLGDGAVVRRAPPPPKPGKTLRRGFEAVHVIIDPGHGGVDPGAVYGSRKKGDQIFEHEVVYDIALRLSGLLNAAGYRTHMTLQDRAQAMPVRVISTRRLGKEKVRVTPPYLIQNDHVGVNMRVFLIDSIFRRLTRKKKVRPENIILMSIHGDALAPTLRGSMVYFPDHRLRLREFRPKGRVYRIRQEALPSTIRFTQAAAKEAHWASKRFGERVIASLKAAGMRVGGRRPVRSYYYRNGERTLPAVLRYSRIPTSVLVEVGNLNNPHDRRAILHSKTRQRIAQGLANAIKGHRPARPTVALRRKAG